MAKRHYDDRNNLLAELKYRKAMADNAISATFSAYMMLSCLVLHEDFELDEENMQAYVDGFYKRMDLYHEGKLTVDSLQKDLLEKVGVYVEPPKVEV